MAPIYEYRCTGCDERWEEESNDVYAPDAMHLVWGKHCGRIVRVWQAGLLRENIRAVKKGG